jgi:hypothetical protein
MPMNFLEVAEELITEPFYEYFHLDEYAAKHFVQTCSGAHPTTIQWVMGDSFSRDKEAGTLTHLQLVPKSGKCESTRIHSLFHTSSRRSAQLVMKRGNFTFFLSNTSLNV